MNVGIIGATGYVGGRLALALLAAGHRVHCLARTPGRLDGVPWRAGVAVVKADVLDGASLSRAFEGLDAVHCLVHAMGHTADFERVDRTGAQNTRTAAEEAGVGRLVYLGGLGGLGVGDALDFFRVEVCDPPRLLRPATEARGTTVESTWVEVCDPPRLLRLRAEMKLPGQAWLEWRVQAGEGGAAVLQQSARFHPCGVAGRLYWWLLLLPHAVIWRRLLAGLVRAAQERSKGPSKEPGPPVPTGP